MGGYRYLKVHRGDTRLRTTVVLGTLLTRLEVEKSGKLEQPKEKKSGKRS